jgi:hypothetical protein
MRGGRLSTPYPCAPEAGSPSAGRIALVPEPFRRPATRRSRCASVKASQADRRRSRLTSCASRTVVGPRPLSLAIRSRVARVARHGSSPGSPTRVPPRSRDAGSSGQSLQAHIWKEGQLRYGMWLLDAKYGSLCGPGVRENRRGKPVRGSTNGAGPGSPYCQGGDLVRDRVLVAGAPYGVLATREDARRTFPPYGSEGKRAGRSSISGGFRRVR